MTSRIVLITGANSGVGYATAKVLADASKDFHVIMTGRSLDKVQTAKSEIESSGISGTLSVVQLNIIDDGSINNAVKEVEQTHGRLDALINNAAVGSRGPDLKVRMKEAFETNVIGCAAVAEAFRPLLLKSSNPYSIFVSSGAGSIGRLVANGHANSLPYEDAYRSSKAALNMIAVLEARDYGPKGLKVFPMCPGFVISNLRGTSEEERTGWGGAVPAERSGKLVLSILQGERDHDVGKLVFEDGVHPW